MNTSERIERWAVLAWLLASPPAGVLRELGLHQVLKREQGALQDLVTRLGAADELKRQEQADLALEAERTLTALATRSGESNAARLRELAAIDRREQVSGFVCSATLLALYWSLCDGNGSDIPVVEQTRVRRLISRELRVGREQAWKRVGSGAPPGAEGFVGDALRWLRCKEFWESARETVSEDTLALIVRWCRAEAKNRGLSPKDVDRAVE